MATENQSQGAQLFNLLNRDYVTFTPDDKTEINQIVTQDTKVFESQDFLSQTKDDIKASETVLKNLKTLKEEGLFADVKNPADMAARSIQQAREPQEEPPVQKQTQQQTAKPANEQTQPSKQPQPAKRKSLTIEQLEEGDYRGSLTAEQQQQLKAAQDKKNIAHLENKDGDRDLSKRLKPSEDKFKDEDVVKYMYEEWFLGGMSWLFNKAESSILGGFDAALDKAARRRTKSTTSKKGDKSPQLTVATAKVADFANITQNAMQNLGNNCFNKKQDYQKRFAELRGLKDGSIKESDLKHFDKEKDKEFLQKVKSDPQFVHGLNASQKRINDDIDMLQTTGKLAFMIASIEMTDEMMRSDKMWRIDGKRKNSYYDEQQMSTALLERQKQIHQGILDAVSVIQEDNRLHGVIALESETDPKNKNAYLNNAVNLGVAAFIQNLNDKVTEVAKKQAENVAEGNFEVVGKLPGSDIRKDLKNIHKMIEDTKNYGAIFNHKVFETEKSKEKVEQRQSLLRMAMEENAPRSNQNIMSQALNSVDQSLAEIAASKMDNAQRKASVEKLKARILKHEGRETFDKKIMAIKQQNSSRG